MGGKGAHTAIADHLVTRVAAILAHGLVVRITDHLIIMRVVIRVVKITPARDRDELTHARIVVSIATTVSVSITTPMVIVMRTLAPHAQSEREIRAIDEILSP